MKSPERNRDRTHPLANNVPNKNIGAVLTVNKNFHLTAWDIRTPLNLVSKFFQQDKIKVLIKFVRPLAVGVARSSRHTAAAPM